jgi:hypothetical protein
VLGEIDLFAALEMDIISLTEMISLIDGSDEWQVNARNLIIFFEYIDDFT